MSDINFGEFIGYFATEFSNTVLLGGSLFAAIIASGALSSEEGDGTAEFLLTHPISRSKILLAKLLSIITRILILNLAICAVVLACMIAVSESTPGPIMVNLATYVGSSQAGIPGALIATIAVVLPSFIIILLVTALLKTVLKNPYVQAALRGLKPCMIGIILATGVYMIIRNGIVIQEKVILIRPLILTLMLALIYFGSRKISKNGISPIMLICISAIAGAALYGL
jgi:chromate transporter